MNGGNSSNGHINFFTGPNGSTTEKMRITQDGNVGIGTTSPSYKLHVDGGNTGNSLFVNGYVNGSAYGQSDKFVLASGTRLWFYDSNAQIYRDSSVLRTYGNDGLSFNFSGSKGMTVGSTAASNGSLDIYGNTGNKLLMGYFTDQGADDPTLRMYYGKATRPGYSFTSDNTSGMFGGSGGGFVAFAASQTERLRVGSDVEVKGATDFNVTGTSRRINFTAGTGTVRTTTANSLYLGTDSTTAITIDSNQNVGIGTTSPQSELHVDGIGIFNVSGNWQQGNGGTHLFRAGYFSSSIDENATALKVYPASYADRGANKYWGGISFMHLDPENSTWHSTYTGDHFWVGGRLIDQPGQERSALVFATNNGTTAGSHATERMVIMPDGDVGIGVTNPLGKLTVDGGVRSKYVLLGSTAADSADNTIEFVSGVDSTTYIGGHINYHGSGNLTLVYGGGSVGIGTNSPSYKLDVTGDVRITNTLTVSDSNTVASYIYLISSASGESELRMGDTDTDAGSIAYNNADDMMKFRTGGVNRVYIDSVGNVGIGVDNPAFQLDVYEPSTNVVAKFKSGDNQAWISVQDDASGTYGAMLGTDTDNNQHVILADNSANKRLVINGDGNVGIGTTSPSQKLHVYGGYIKASDDGGTTAFMQGGSGASYAYFGALGNGPAAFGNSENYTTLVADGGNVGIGTTSPGAKLDVSGSVYVRSGNELRLYNPVGNDWAVLNYTGTSHLNLSNTIRIQNASNVNSLYPSVTEVTDLGRSSFQFRDGYLSRNLTVGGDMTVDGIITAKEFHTTFVSASIIFQSGSTVFGNSADDIHEFTGNVGIGTATPASSLHVQDGNIRVYSDSYGSTGLLRFFGTDNAEKLQIGSLSTGGFIYTPANRYFAIYTGGSENMRIDANGNVGIGTTAPSSGSLQIYNTSGTNDIVFDGGTSTANSYIGSFAGGMYLSTNYSYASGHRSDKAGLTSMEMYMDHDVIHIASMPAGSPGTRTRVMSISGSQGYVGIGSSNPGYKLDVTDAARIDGVRMGRDFSIANRATVRIDANGNAPADILFGQTAAANETLWNGVYWSISSRDSGGGAAQGQKFTIWRGNEHASPNNSESQFITITPDLKFGIGDTTPSYKLTVAGEIYGTALRIDSGGGNSIRIGDDFGDGGTATIHNNANDLYLQFNANMSSSILRLGGGGTAVSVLDQENNNYRIGTNATASYFGYNSGNVGIGTNNPGEKLHVVGAVKTSRTTGASENTFIYNQATAKWGSSTYPAIIESVGNNSFLIGSSQNIPLHLARSGAIALTVGTSGNVGIGNKSPSSKLHVTDATDISMGSGGTGQFRVEGNGYTGAIALDDSAMHIYHNSAARALILGTNETAAIEIHQSNQTLRFHGYGAGYLQSDASGNVTVDNSTFLTAESDTLATVTGRGNTTTQNIEIVHSTGQGFYSGPDSFQSFGSGVSTILLQGTQANGRAGALWFKGVNGDDVASLYVTDDTQDNYGTTLVAYSGSIRFATQTLAAEKMTITADGDVGIGTTPSEALHIYRNASSAEVRLQNNTISSYIRSSTDNLNFYVSNGEKVRIQDDGNVGINKTVPTEKLDVAGNAKAYRFISSNSSTNGVFELAYSDQHKSVWTTSLSFSYTAATTYNFNLVFRNSGGYHYDLVATTSRNGLYRNFGTLKDSSHIYWESDGDFAHRAEGDVHLISNYGNGMYFSADATSFLSDSKTGTSQNGTSTWSYYIVRYSIYIPYYVGDATGSWKLHLTTYGDTGGSNPEFVLA
jgi:hypothetical protein